MQAEFEKIIEKLEEEKMFYFLTIANTGDEKLDYTYEKAGNALDKAIEIVKQEAEKFGRDTNVGSNGWIPCDGVHFPEENVYVRVTTWTETEKIGFRRDGKWFVYGSDGMAEATVLAWQPTQPYQPKGE